MHSRQCLLRNAAAGRGFETIATISTTSDQITVTIDTGFDVILDRI